jgi:hypothetical protein
MEHFRDNRQFIVSYDRQELIITMCALVEFLANATKELASSNIQADHELTSSGKMYCEKIEQLIMRHQDIIDADEIS